MAASVNSTRFPWLLWMYEGVDYTLPGNGGIECASFLSPTRKIVETIVFLVLGCLEILFAKRFITLPNNIPSEFGRDRTGKKLLLALFCLVYGIELGYKFATKQMIWIFNPCHIITMTQVSR